MGEFSRHNLEESKEETSHRGLEWAGCALGLQDRQGEQGRCVRGAAMGWGRRNELDQGSWEGGGLPI